MNPIERDLAREELTIASYQKRIKAYLLDESLIGLVVLAALWERLGALSDNPLALIETVNSYVVWIALFHIIYHTIFVALYGATLGKMWQRIIVIEIGGFGKPSFVTALIRALTRVVSDLCMALGFLWAFADPLRQTWHDKFSRVIVIDAP
ncbi:MAG: RDD family protein [Helicobacteraceae bacterium]|jgi:uncharacterized RDD family membrane protein YckC|nr:RDD family protein [Helicobacteraceae bacterium]